MRWVHWAVLGTFFCGFAYSPLWIGTFLLYELGIRQGRDVAAFWAESLIRSRRGNRD